MVTGSRKPRRRRGMSFLYCSSLSSGIISSGMAILLFLSARTIGAIDAKCERAVCALFPLVCRKSPQSGPGANHDRSAGGSTPVGRERVVQKPGRGAHRSPAVRPVVPASIPHPGFLRPALMATWSKARHVGSDQPPCSRRRAVTRPVVARREVVKADHL